jgi:hypothetical protein
VEPRGTETEEPKSPKSLKLSLRGSVKRQAPLNVGRVGWASRGADQYELIERVRNGPDQYGLIGQLAGTVNEEIFLVDGFHGS